MLDQVAEKIYCVGIGGIGVGALAEYFHLKGKQVSGSDVSSNKVTERLQQLGVVVYAQHQAEQVSDAQLVIYSSAIDKGNPELCYAREQGIPCVKRGDVLAGIFNDSVGVAVAGSHGKTTTTSLLSRLFKLAKLSPSYFIGGVLNDEDSPICIGDGEYFIVESDESDRSFLQLRPNIAVVTNIDHDHLNNYQDDYSQLLDAFTLFLNRLPDDGFAIVNVDDPGVRAILPQLTCRVLTFGVKSQADYQIKNLSFDAMQSSFDLTRPGKGSFSIILNMPGQYNVENAVPSCILADVLGIDDNVMAETCCYFPGVGRRMSHCGTASVSGGEVLLLEDYGHHPRAIKATLNALRHAWPKRRLVVVFQPHRYSRTKQLLQEFARLSAYADYFVILGVYAASETELAGGTAHDLFELIATMGRAEQTILVDDIIELPVILKSIIRSEDIILLQGAGSVGAQAPEILHALEQG